MPPAPTTPMRGRQCRVVAGRKGRSGAATSGRASDRSARSSAPLTTPAPACAWPAPPPRRCRRCAAQSGRSPASRGAATGSSRAMQPSTYSMPLRVPSGRGSTRQGVALGPGAGLEGHVIGVILAGQRAVLAHEGEAAGGLGLMGPGVGEGAPARLHPGEARPVAAHGDRVLIDLDPLAGVHRARHLEGRRAVPEPSPQRRAVAHVVEQAAPARGGGCTTTIRAFGGRPHPP